MPWDNWECSCWRTGITRRYPCIIKYAKENGIEDTSVILESYGMDKPIMYHMLLEHTEMLKSIQEMRAIPASSVLGGQ